jgi:hypothetical protein
MKIACQMSCLAVLLLAPAPFLVRGTSQPAPGPDTIVEAFQGHASDLMANLTLSDGTRRTVQLEGIGCSVAMCSRVAIKGQAASGSLVRTWLDNLAAIRSTASGRALLVMKDGTERQISLVRDFRVLYLARGHGGDEKLDLAKVRSVEFAAAAK